MYELYPESLILPKSLPSPTLHYPRKHPFGDEEIGVLAPSHWLGVRPYTGGNVRKPIGLRCVRRLLEERYERSLAVVTAAS